jgi:VWFA-related protein
VAAYLGKLGSAGVRISSSKRPGSAGSEPTIRHIRVAIALLFLVSATSADARQLTGNPIPNSAARIDLTSVGYAGLPPGARQSSQSNLSLDFLDSTHVLLTFNSRKLVKRLPECPPTHDDRIIHAAILELPSGRVVKETEWYLHDFRRYLWNLGRGRFLLRKLNRLYAVDSQFGEQLVLDSPAELMWITVTPDGRQILAETPEETRLASTDKRESSPVKISFFNADSLAAERVMRSKSSIQLKATTLGFADVRETGANVWLVRFGAGTRDRVNITRVRSRVPPNILYSGTNTLLIGRCSLSKDAYNLSAFTVTGKHLWRQRWEACRYSPAVKASEEGNRIAVVSAAIRTVPDSVTDPEQADSPQEGLMQTVQVLDVLSGNAVLAVSVDQAVWEAANVSLSPDGSQVAIIDGSTLSLYLLPEMSSDEKLKLVSLKADVPQPLLQLPGRPSTAEETLDISVAESSASQEQTPAEPKPSAPDASGSKTESPALPGSSIPTVTFRTGTQIVALDVVATDAHGQVVKGLLQRDFAVTENGTPQMLRGFHQYIDGQAPAEIDRHEAERLFIPERLSENVFSNVGQPSTPRAVTVILFDLLNTSINDQGRAQAELVKVLKNKPKETQFALCILSDKLQMIQGFTRDEAVLLAAARSKKASLRHKSHLESDSARVSLEAATATAELRPELTFFVQSVLLQESQLRIMDADRRMYTTVDAFAQLARYLSGIPGRKNLVWLSGSFTLGLSPDSLPPDRDQMAFTQVRNYSDNLKKVSNLLAEAQVALYPVDVSGLVTDPLFTARSNDVLAPLSMTGSTPLGPSPRGGRTPFARPADTAVPIVMMQNQANDFGLEQIGQHTTMDRLASETGGQAFYNSNGIAAAIDTAVTEGSNYYALSYTPSNKEYNGAFRKIHVSVPGKKIHLAYRKGYYAVAPNVSPKAAKDLASELAQAAMQGGAPQSRQIVFAARVVPVGKSRKVENAAPARTKRKPSLTNKEMQLYSIEYVVRAGDLRFTSVENDTQRDVLNFMVTAFDEDGILGASQISQVDVHLREESARQVQKEGLRFHQEVDVPASSVALRLGVADATNSHIGTLEVPLPVKAPTENIAVKRPMPPVEPDE